MQYCCLLLVAGSCLAAAVPAPDASGRTTLVSTAGGRLAMSPYSDRGDVLPDFSWCGYGGGGVALPAAAVRRELQPAAAGDDLARVQAALDEVARLPLDGQGLRGAVLLRRGRYRVGGPLKITASGVVLRGEGDGEDGTVLVATRRQQHTLIQVTGAGNRVEDAASRRAIVDAFVPVGARTFRVADAAGFRVGDAVIVHRPSTAAWIADLGMDRIPARSPGLVQWQPGRYDLRFERTILALDGDRVTIDAPLVNALDERYGGGTVVKCTFADRITNVGVEHLRGESEYADPKDEEHGWNLIGLDKVQDAWVRRVTSRWFGYSCVSVGRYARNVTVTDCQCLDPVSQITGGRRYSFALSGSLNLVQRCFARHGRHDFVMHSVVPGPNVFLDCRAEQAHSDSGPHHRWSVGTLYDNLVTDGALNVENRMWSGTGHGWAGALMVFWNCRAKSLICQEPTTSQNFAIGCQGKRVGGNYVKDGRPGWFESHGAPVEPRSLYRAQLVARLGPAALAVVDRPGG